MLFCPFREFFILFLVVHLVWTTLDFMLNEHFSNKYNIYT